MRAEPRLEDARHPAHDSAPDRGHDEKHRNRHHRTQPRREHQPHQRRGESTGRELALGANIEQAGAQPDRDREARERERRGFVQHLSEADRYWLPRAIEQQSVHGAWGLSKGENGEQIPNDRRDQAARDNRRKDRLLDLPPRESSGHVLTQRALATRRS